MPYLTLGEASDSPPLAIHYEEWGEHQSSAVVLVHELGGTLESFRAFAGMLGARYRVIAFDQRGAGLSEKPVVPFKLGDLADDIGRLAAALSITAPFHLMGLAMGAVTALHFAVRHSASLASLILCDGTSEINSASRAYLLDRAAAARRDGMRAVTDATVKAAFRGLGAGPVNAVLDSYRDRFMANAPESYALQMEALAGMQLTTADLSQVTCRTLALTGKHDVIWPPATGEALAARLPNARFEMVDGAAHFPPIQCTEQLASRVTRHLDEPA